MKEQIIQLPDNFEVKEVKDGKIILVEKEKKLTYDDIARELFSKPAYYIGTVGNIRSAESLSNYATNPNNCASRKQGEKLLAINKLMNVAKYLNNGWQPDWSNSIERKYFIQIETIYKVLHIDCTGFYNSDIVCFKSEKLAQQAIDILGEETIRLALSTDY